MSAAAREGRRAGWGPRVQAKPLPAACSSPLRRQRRRAPVAPGHAWANSLTSDLDATSSLPAIPRADSSKGARKTLLLLFTQGNFVGYQQPVMSLLEEHVRDQTLLACLLREAPRCVCSAGVDSNPDFPGSQAPCSHLRAKHLLAARARELEAAFGKGFRNFGSGPD